LAIFAHNFNEEAAEDVEGANTEHLTEIKAVRLLLKGAKKAPLSGYHGRGKGSGPRQLVVQPLSE
jgi:hypothetical protein